VSRLYIDLTTSIRWRRPPVGIVRVEREFAAYCLAHEADTVFCEIDSSGEYRALTPTRVREVLDDSWCQSAAPQDAVPAPIASPLTQRGRVQRIADWAAAWGPKIVPAAAYPLLRDLGRVLVDHHGAFVRNRAAKRAVRARLVSAQGGAAAHATPTTAALANTSIAPTAADTFFSIGLQWHHGAIHAYNLKRATGVRVVEFCHDTIPIDLPEYSGSAKQPFAEYFTCLAHTADLIAANSDSSRNNLHAFYQRVGILQEPTLRTVRLASPKVHLAAESQVLRDDEREILEQVSRRKGHVLYVSTFEIRKNHRLLLHLWKEFYVQRGNDCPVLVLVGMFGWGVSDLWAEMQASDVFAAGKIVILHHVSDALLASLYSSCLFTVFPSFYEGWGLAANESLAYGKLVITSDAPALSEATQGLGPAIHPLDYPRWRETIAYYIDDDNARATAEARIRATYVPRHWDEFSRDLLGAARELS